MRKAVTLLEVMIAVGVAAIGLLGCLALFTVGNRSVERGLRADVTRVASEEAINTFAVRGLRRPDAWVRWNASLGQIERVADGAQLPGEPLDKQTLVIDPVFFEQSADDIPQADLWSHFPAVPAASMPNGGRAVRLGLYSGLPSSPRMPLIVANEITACLDELGYERPEDHSQPAVQIYEQMQNGTGAARRQERGRVRWMAMLSPKLYNAAGNGDGRYVLWLVLFHGRSLGQGNVETVATIAAGDFHSLGNGGGEVTITSAAPLEITSGSWVCLARSYLGHPMFAWYRVGSYDPETGDASLLGGDWPADLNSDNVSEPCDVVHVQGVVHVAERTIGLED